MALNRERSRKAHKNLCTSFLSSKLSGCRSLATGDVSLKTAGRTRSSRETKEEVGGNGGWYAGDTFFFANLSIENIANDGCGKFGVA
jgi:hypothetical protein